MGGKRMTHQIDVHSGTWLRIKAHVDERIEELRRQIETEGQDPRKSDFIRGEISALRAIASLNSAGVQPDIEAPAEY